MTCKKCKSQPPEGALFCPQCGCKLTAAPKTHKTRTRPNGAGSVYKRGKTWSAQYTCGWVEIDGKMKRRKRTKDGFKTKTEAMEYITQLKTAGSTKQVSPTFSSLYDAWLPTHKASKSTIDCYKAAWKYFEDVSFLRIEDISIDDLQECIDDCPKGKRTRQNMKAVCGLIYKYAIPRGYVPSNLNLAQYLIVGDGEQQHHEGFTDIEIEKISQCVGSVKYADYVYCMIYLGFRPSEFLALTVADYDPKQKLFIGGAKTEAGKNRCVTVSPKILPIVERLAAGRTEGAFFADGSGEHFELKAFTERHFYAVLEAAGIDNPKQEGGRHRLTPHSCRHTFATLMKRVGGSDKDKMQLIGHSSTEMLRYYQDVSTEDLRHITDVI